MGKFAKASISHQSMGVAAFPGFSDCIFPRERSYRRRVGRARVPSVEGKAEGMTPAMEGRRLLKPEIMPRVLPCPTASSRGPDAHPRPPSSGFAPSVRLVLQRCAYCFLRRPCFLTASSQMCAPGQGVGVSLQAAAPLVPDAGK